MLAITRETLIYLRNIQQSSDELLRRKMAANRAPPKAQQLGRDRFNNLVDDVVGILKTGRSSKFEFEGACRHGIRQTLCLEGWKWSDADASADAIVRMALGQIGAERPAWAQGQPGWTEEGFAPVERVRCVHCGGPFDTEDGRDDRRYCSIICRNAGKRYRASLSEARVTRAEFYARLAAQKAKSLREREQDCEHCGKPFTDTNYTRRRFCSIRCASCATGRRLRDRSCPQCGSVFRPRTGETKFCGKPCAAKAQIGALLRPKRSCEHCGNEYQPDRVGSRFCSNSCSQRARASIVEKTCERCGTGFTRPAGSGKRIKYCSIDCSRAATADAHRKARPEQTCPTCLSIFRSNKPPSEAPKYCSRRCARTGGRLSTIGIVMRCEEVPPLAPDEIEPIVSAFRCDEA